MNATPAVGQQLELAGEERIVTARVVASDEGRLTVEFAAPIDLHVGALCATRVFDGMRVWHLEFEVVEIDGLRVALRESDRRCVGEERAAERAACASRAIVRIASPAEDGLGAWAEVIDLSVAGVRFRSEAGIAGGTMVDLDIDDGSGNLISMRVVVLDSTGGICRGSIVAIGSRAVQRLTQVIAQARAAGTLHEPESDPLAELRAALTAGRERHRLAS